MAFSLTENQFEQLIRNKESKQWYDEVALMLPKYDIIYKERVAGFLAQTGHESQDYTIMSENLNYSAKRLNQVFPKYFARAGRNAALYHRQPERIANVVYANRMSNGGVDSGDGWRYRGGGILQLTGKDNYTRFGRYVGMSPEKAADYVRTKRGAVESACWFWKVNNLNSFCDRRDIRGMSVRINGGTNGLTDRVNRWNKALRVLDDDTVKFSTIRKGSSGSAVKAVQEKLGLPQTGTFDARMDTVVRKWQAANNLVVDGIVGPNTYREMFG